MDSTMAEDGVVVNVPPTAVAVDIEESSMEDTKVESPSPPLNNVTKNDIVVNNTDILLPAPDLNDTDPLLDIEPINNNNGTSSPTVSPSVSSTEDTNTSSPTSSPSVHQTSTPTTTTVSTTTVPSLAPSVSKPTTPSPTTKDYYYYNNFFTDRHNLILGCSPKNYFIDPANLVLGTSHSLYKLYFDEILPKIFIPKAKEHDSHSTPLVMQHVDTDMFLTENSALYPGVVTTNDVYNMISIEEMFVPLAHGVHGDQVLELIDEFAINNDTDTVAVSSTIKNRQKYTIYTITQDEDSLRDSM